MRKEYFIGGFKVTQEQFDNYLEQWNDEKQWLQVTACRKKLHRDFLQFMFDEHFIVFLIGITGLSLFVGKLIAPFIVFIAG